MSDTLHIIIGEPLQLGLIAEFSNIVLYQTTPNGHSIYGKLKNLPTFNFIENQILYDNDPRYTFSYSANDGTNHRNRCHLQIFGEKSGLRVWYPGRFPKIIAEIELSR